MRVQRSALTRYRCQWRRSARQPRADEPGGGAGGRAPPPWLIGSSWLIGDRLATSSIRHTHTQGHFARLAVLYALAAPALFWRNSRL